MQDILIPEDWLEAKGRQTRQCIEDVRANYVPDIDDPDYGWAFRNYLLFEHCPALVSEGLTFIDPKKVFYNKYFWFCRFANLYASKNGPDAGIEQQQFKMVDEANWEVDFGTITALTDLAKGK